MRIQDVQHGMRVKVTGLDMASVGGLSRVQGLTVIVTYRTPSGAFRDIAWCEDERDMIRRVTDVSGSLAIVRLEGASGDFLPEWLEPVVEAVTAGPRVTAELMKELLYDVGIRGLDRRQKLAVDAWLAKVNAVP